MSTPFTQVADEIKSLHDKGQRGTAVTVMDLVHMLRRLDELSNQDGNPGFDPETQKTYQVPAPYEGVFPRPFELKKPVHICIDQQGTGLDLSVLEGELVVSSGWQLEETPHRFIVSQVSQSLQGESGGR